MSRRRSQNGYTLIEIVLVMIILGILASLALTSLGTTIDVTRTEETMREMERLAQAITGNPTLTSGGGRTDFGYIGDVGALPPDWDALVVNPGYATWDGPYLQDDFAGDASNSDFKQDAWGVEYSSPGAGSFSSTGGSDILTRSLANSVADLLYNPIFCSVVDLDLSPPGPVNRDSVKALLTYPDGAGSSITRTAYPTANGLVLFDSIPIGRHRLRVVFIPAGDTLTRMVAVDPGQVSHVDIQHFAEVW